MEQYFEITKESSHYKEYFDYLEADEACEKSVKSFLDENGIHTDYYAISRDKLWIDDTEENRNQFGSQLTKYGEQGLVAFKKTSKIGKKWTMLNVKKVRKPFVPFFFSDVYGKSHSRLFHVVKKLYCSIDCPERDTKVNTPQEFIEMKASEFFKIVEEQED